MNKFFIALYDFFETRRTLLFTLLAVALAAMGAVALQLRFSENITGFFPDGERKAAAAFSNLKIKDKIVVMVNARQGMQVPPEQMMACADALAARLGADTLFRRYAEAEASFGSDLIDNMRAFLQGNLPLLLTEADYARMDTLVTRQGIARAMEENYRRLLSPVGGFIDEYIYDDPLGLSFGVLGKLQRLNIGGNYTLCDDYLFSKDMATLAVFISPQYESGDTGVGDRLVERIESVLGELNAEYAATGITIDYYGAPAVAAYNARQIKRDMMLTLNIAILVIVIFITLSFRNKFAVLLALIPVALGGLFALALMSLVCHTISSIAVGAGTVVMGIALSYSIHILCHANHCHDPRQIIRDLAYPLTIGSITTIGAFAGLLFTDSQLLRDFGLFASLTLVGTTFFSLAVLPHLIRKGERGGGSAVLRGVERLTGMRPDRSRPLVAAILLLTLVCLFFFNRIGFDSDMMHLNYDAPHLVPAQQRLSRLMDDDGEHAKVLFITTGDTQAEAVAGYLHLERQLDSLKRAGKIDSYAGIAPFVVDSAEQQRRLERWQKFWTTQRRETLREGIREAERRYGFAQGAFGGALQLTEKTYTQLDYSSAAAREVFREWVDGHGTTPLFLSHVTLADSCKQEVYATFSAADDIVVADRAFYAGKMAQSVNHNFYLILSISSILVTVALFLCYGRIELTVMSLLPMGIGWVIILGLMALFGVEFNIVTIILSTFIFGIGDDFSIFIMDGLLSEYKTGRRMLDTHKTAIFFSAFTVVVGLGALIFARHPALHSLALISLFGIVAVVLVSYTIQPVLFRMLVSSQTEKGGAPYTLGSLLNTFYAFGLFVTGCQLLQALIFTLWPLPVARRRKQRIVQWSIHHMTRGFLRAMFTTKTIRENEPGETFARPAVVIANHQSFIDILVLLSICPKAVMVTNGWVWRSLVFGRIVRYLGFYHAADGYERLAPALAQKVAEGYSVIVFPEGTRSADGKIGRFHKGAFYLAGKLGLDILPICLYGNGMISSKRQPIYIKHGLVVSRILPRIAAGDPAQCSDVSKAACRLMRGEYRKLYERYNRPCNPYFRDMLIKSYTYKGPVLEWYMRIKIRLERCYELFNRIVPREGTVVDLGCGYGPLSYMLAMLSDRRRIVGMDYDAEKIETARHSFLRRPETTFLHADLRTAELPEADVFLLVDVLHYMQREEQRTLIGRCAARLNPGGRIIVRDGDSSKARRHKATAMTELWSTKIVGFNKTDGELHFTSTSELEQTARSFGMELHAAHKDTRTSNTVYILTRQE